MRLRSDVVIGIFRNVSFAQPKSKLTIEDEDGDIHYIIVNFELVRSLASSDLLGAKAILTTREGYSWEPGSSGDGWLEIYEVLHLLAGPRVGETFTYKHERVV